MIHVYSFGKKDRNFLFLTPRQAKIMNDFTKSFFKSQAKYLEKTGQKWDPNIDPRISMFVPKKNPDLIKNYNKLVPYLNRQHQIRNKIYDLLKVKLNDNADMDDYLVKRL